MSWVLIEKLPYRRHVGAVMLTAYPVIAFILLTGGNSDTSSIDISTWLIIGLAFISVARMGSRGYLGSFLKEVASVFSIIGWAVILLTVVRGIVATDFGQPQVDTRDWGVSDYPSGGGHRNCGFFAAWHCACLGRRSQMPIVRIVSTVFIEFWRGVPLITVLFMASVMLPLFLPEGVNFDNLLRVLIGVMLFSAAYMAEVVEAGFRPLIKDSMRALRRWGLATGSQCALLSCRKH